MASSAKTPNPRGARSIQRILDAAARIFGREGFQGASMSAVARAAGVSKGLLHYHFDSKEHLLIEAQRATFRQIHSRFQERHQAGQVGVDGALEVLDNLWDALRGMRLWAPFMVEILALGAHRGTITNTLEDFVSEGMVLLESGITKVFGDDLTGMEVSASRMGRLVRVSMYGLIVELAYARDEEQLATVDQTYQDLRDTFAVIAMQRRG